MFFEESFGICGVVIDATNQVVFLARGFNPDAARLINRLAHGQALEDLACDRLERVGRTRVLMGVVVRLSTEAIKTSTKASASGDRSSGVILVSAWLGWGVAYAGSEEPDNTVVVAQQSLTITANTQSRRTAGQLARVPGMLTTIGGDDHARRLQRRLATRGKHR